MQLLGHEQQKRKKTQFSVNVFLQMLPNNACQLKMINYVW